MDSRGNELFDFLAASPYLKHLTLDSFELIDGSWEVVVGKIDSALQLKSVMLHRLYGGFPDFVISLDEDDYSDRYTYTNDHRLIENFFLQGGENPFTEEAMKLWYGKDLATRQRMNKNLECEQHYHMYH